jgi:hypothetical protein
MTSEALIGKAFGAALGILAEGEPYLNGDGIRDRLLTDGTWQRTLYRNNKRYIVTVKIENGERND